MRFRRLACLAGLALLAACGWVRPAPTPTPAPVLDDTRWVLTALNGHALMEGTHITLDFRGGEASGYGGCNAYGGRYQETASGTLALSEFSITVMGCFTPAGLMEQESEFTQAFLSTTSFRMAGDTLELRDASGQTLLVFARQAEYPGDPARLLGSRWQLTSLDGKDLLPGTDITLAFAVGKVSGHAGCRDYWATYDASGDDLHFVYLEMVSTDCELTDALLTQEGEYTTMLGWVDHYRLQDNRLELFTQRGETLTFTRLP